ncbi:hypothetical protein ABT160_43710 [Streptomyces sp. NPDC001941]|uniref:hypothetical protein n=1 Tax=Streptomyces sp. NPDC001941 TaxID=3154659 RepID=UPI003318BE4F
MAAITGLAALAASTGVVLGAGPALAGPSCSSGYHCVFKYQVGSTKHSYFDSDANFTNDYFGDGSVVNDNVWGASNSSTGGYESHYYRDINYAGGLVFCVNPGSSVYELPAGKKDAASSLKLRGTTSISCY